MLFMGERFLQQTYVTAIILLMNVVACAGDDKDAIQPAAEAVATSVVLTYSSRFHIAVKYGEKLTSPFYQDSSHSTSATSASGHAEEDISSSGAKTVAKSAR